MSAENNNNGLPARVRNLEVRAAVEELKANYGRRADALFSGPSSATATALADLFTDDGVLDLGPFGKYEGRAALLDAFENVLPQGTRWSVHYFNNLILSVNGDSAEGSWYFRIESLPAGEGASVIQILGRYDDVYRATDAGWKIERTAASYFVPPT